MFFDVGVVRSITNYWPINLRLFLFCRQYIEDHRIMTTLSVLLGVDINPSGDSMDIDPPTSAQFAPKQTSPGTSSPTSAHSVPKQTSQPKPPEPEPETTENLTDDELKVGTELYITILSFHVLTLYDCRLSMKKNSETPRTRKKTLKLL